MTFLFGVSKFLFTALALGVVIALFASYFVAVTVVPLFCANFLKAHHTGGAGHGSRQTNPGERRFHARLQRQIRSAAELLRTMGRRALDRPWQVVGGIPGSSSAPVSC